METQVNQILAYMRSNGGITNMDAYEKLHMTDLAQRIKDARDNGYTIITVMEKSKNGKQYGRYILKEKENAR